MADMPEILIYDEIGYWGVEASTIAEELTSIDADNIRLRINSPGGDAFAGIALYNLLKTHRARVEMVVDGLAASAASVVAMAGDWIMMASNASMMIHNAWTVAMGDGTELRKVAERLEAVDEQIAQTYHETSRASLLDIQEWMDAEQWFTAEEAVDVGLAHGMVGTEKVAASIAKPVWIRHLPDRWNNRKTSHYPPPPHRLRHAERQLELTRRKMDLQSN